MAYLGAIGTLNNAATYSKSVRPWTLATAGMRSSGEFIEATGRRYNIATSREKVAGVVRENNVVAQRLVRVYRRDNGVLLGETTSAVDGTYTIPLGYTGDVFVVCFDAAGAPSLNAAILDYVTPA